MYKAVLQRRNKASVYGKGPSWKNTSQAFAWTNAKRTD
jgi:hypothetical protein